MNPKRRGVKELLLLFLVIVLLATIYVVATWPTDPSLVLVDLGRLGPAAFLIDLIFILVVYRIWRRSRDAKPSKNIAD